MLSIEYIHEENYFESNLLLKRESLTGQHDSRSLQLPPENGFVIITRRQIFQVSVLSLESLSYNEPL